MKQTEKAPLSILIIAQYDPTIDWVQLSLQEQNYQVVGQVHSVEQALQKIQRNHIDIILADSSGDGVPDTKWIRKLAMQSGGSIILVTATNTEMDFIREAMLAGAQAFLLKPFDLAELSRSIEQVYQLWLQRNVLIAEAVSESRQGPAHRAHSLAVFSPKGGTGVTTLAVNLAVALKELTKSPVLLVDADIRAPDVDIFLNIFSKNSILELIHLDQKIDKALLKSVAAEHATGISVLRGDSRLQLLESPIAPGEMSNLIEELVAIWDGYVVINTSNGLDRWTVEILDAVDTVVLTATPELPALRVMRGFLDLAEVEAEPSNKWQLVMTCYQSQKVLRMSDIEASIRYPIKATIAADIELVPASINRGTPLVNAHSKSIVAKDILALAKQLSVLNPDSSQQAPSPNSKETTAEVAPVPPAQSANKRTFFWHSFTNAIRPSDKLERSTS